jgi:hypothetical protein
MCEIGSVRIALCFGSSMKRGFLLGQQLRRDIVVFKFPLISPRPELGSASD